MLEQILETEKRGRDPENGKKWIETQTVQSCLVNGKEKDPSNDRVD